MLLTKFSLKRQITLIMLYAVVILFSFFSFSQLKIDFFPDIAFPFAGVITSYSGVGPDDIETLITRPVEEATRGRCRGCGRRRARGGCGAGLRHCAIKRARGVRRGCRRRRRGERAGATAARAAPRAGVGLNRYHCEGGRDGHKRKQGTKVSAAHGFPLWGFCPDSLHFNVTVYWDGMVTILGG